MSRQRSDAEGPPVKRRVMPRGALRRNAEGRALCRWCQAPVPKGRRTFCGEQKCIDEYNLRRDPGEARRRVYERDRGVCALCRLDCDALERVLAPALRAQWARAQFSGAFPPADRERIEVVWAWLVALGFDLGVSLWQADHIVPVAEGGGECGLDGYRTLCTPCHKRETAALRARLARPRPVAAQPADAQLPLFGAAP